jgi:GAF domain-containing protein
MSPVGQRTMRTETLARTLVEVADALVGDFDIVELLTLLTDRCVEVLDVAAAGIMLASPNGELRVMASSSEATRVVELFEYQSKQGPCLDSYRTGAPVVNVDLGVTDGPWPRLAAEAVFEGFQSVHALPMRWRGTVIGALNLFRTHTGQMAPADAATAQALADVATLAVVQHRAVVAAQLVNDQLQQALDSRVAIEQAKGVVAEGSGVNMEQAFASLRNHARRNNLRLVDVATGVIDGQLKTGDLDGDAGSIPA